MLALRSRLASTRALLALGGLVPLTGTAQVAITSATTLTTDGADTVHEGFTFRNTVVAVQGFSTAAQSYALAGMADQIFIRRSSAANNQAHVWYQTASAGGDRIAPYGSDYADVLLDNNFARGVHNLFGNINTGSANVERLDLIASAGFTATAGFAIPVFDFGVNPQHESFRIALVTGVDGAGNPTAYSALASTVPFVATNLYTHDSFSIHRYNTGDVTTANYTIFNGPNQGPGGIVFTLSDFSVPVGTTIYGYSLFGYDVSDGGNPANLVNWNNATYFPTNTPNGEGQAGGFDFSGVNGIFFSAIPEPSTHALGGLALMVGAAALRRRPVPRG
jgi:hypothetical protein